MTSVDAHQLHAPDDQKPFEQAFCLDGDRLVHRLGANGRVHEATIPRPAGLDPNDLSGAWWMAYLRGVKPEPVAPSGGQVRFAELFSGPGGLALGFSQACAELGLEAVSLAAADQDADALAVYQRRNRTRVTTTESVSMLVDYEVSGQGASAEFDYEPEAVNEDWAELAGGVDVLLAGPPCQGHSNLNNKTRRDDWRNELYLTAPAMAVALGAKVVIIENVRAVLHDRREVVQSSIALLEAAGYEISEGVLKAADMGWPQRRERYFLVATLGSTPIHLGSLSTGLYGDRRPIWWAIEDLEHPNPEDHLTSPPILTDENKRRIDYLHDNELWNLPPSERPECHRDGTTYNAVYGRLRKHDPAPTITTGFMTPGRGRYIHPTQRRVINAREAARLQGFPDDYDFRDRTSALAAKAKLAKWIGDAVPMPLGYAATLSALLAH